MGQPNHWAIVDLTGVNNGGANVYADISGVNVPVAQLSMTYGLNDIPTASIQIPMGSDVRTNVKSPIYDVVANLLQMAEIRIYLAGQLGDFNAGAADKEKNNKWFPTIEEPVIIFMGYVSGVSYRRSSGRITTTIHMVNKLFDLASSSGGSKDVVPGSPNDFMTPTLIGGAGTSAGDAATKFVETLPTDLKEDYSNAVLKCLNYIATNNQLQTHASALWCNKQSQLSSESEPNYRALNVINKFGSWNGIATFSNDPYMGKYTTKYPLEVDSEATIAKASTTISSQISNSLAATHMFGMLTNSVLPSFSFGIVPMARGAIMAPCLTMAKNHQITIPTSDYVDFNFSTQGQRALAGVGVLGNYALGTLTPGQPKYCIGASYASTVETAKRGMWMFVNAPEWLEDMTNSDPKGVTGDAGINKVLAKPGHDAVGIDEIAVKRDELKQEIEDTNDTMEKFAKMMYINQALTGRGGTLTGKLRFDIAPATTIKISAGPEDALFSLTTDIYAFVSRVHIVINAEQASAATTFDLTNLRTANENANGLSFDEHPLFGKSYFKYAPIVPELSLDPEK